MARPDIVAEINTFNTWTPSQFLEIFGGSTKRAAEELGVSQRTMERYVTTSAQKRKPSPSTQAHMNVIGRRSIGDVGITLDGMVAVNDKKGDYKRNRTIDRIFSPDQWARISAMAARGDEQGILDFIADDYGVNSIEVTDGDILIGEE